jgi:hypothetical protein
MEKGEEVLNRNEMMHANISLILDSYHDIFSSFDPRPFGERALSIDFLDECKRAAREQENGIELILSLPRNKRSIGDELKIRKRLKEHFHKHFLEKQSAINRVKREGGMWIFIGSFLLILDTFMKTYIPESFLMNLVTILIEPASWFSFWEGLGKIFIHSKDNEPDFIFYRKMASANISFRSY